MKNLTKLEWLIVVGIVTVLGLKIHYEIWRAQELAKMLGIPVWKALFLFK